MEENKQTLRDALGDLPSYSAPDEVWGQIEEELNREVKEAPLQVALRALPSYEPPAVVWDQIENQLPTTAKVRVLHPTALRWAGFAAAAVALLLLARPFWQSTGSEPIAYETTVSYRTETVDARLLDRDWTDDEQAFAQVDELCERHPFLCKLQDITDMRTELQELTQAKEALQTALGSYGTDQHLLKQMTKIELERTQLLKKLLNRII
ncbi:MAG: hypothetical protein AAFU60_07000 [Bacteroidota bacterium]